MSITVSNLLKQRRYPFIASLVLLLLFVTLFILTTNTSQPPPLYRLRQPSVTTTTPSPLTNVTNNIITDVDDSDDVSNGDGLEELEWKLCPGPLAVDYIPCLDNWKVIKSLRSRRHMEHRERHCPNPKLRCLIPLPDGYKVPVRWPKSRDMVRLLVW